MLGTFPHLIKPEKVGQRGAPVYEAQLVMDPSHPMYQTVRSEAMRAAQLEFGSDLSGVEWTLSSGDKVAQELLEYYAKKGKETKPVIDYLRGKFVIKARSNMDNPPSLSYFDGPNLIDIPVSERERHAFRFFPGALVLARVAFKAWAVDGKRGVKTYLNGIVATGLGTQIPGTSGGQRSNSSSTTMTSYRGHLSNENPLASSATQVSGVPF